MSKAKPKIVCQHCGAELSPQQVRELVCSGTHYLCEPCLAAWWPRRDKAVAKLITDYTGRFK